MRLIRIDTPETKRPATPLECGGREASASLLSLSFSAPEDSDGDGLLDRKGGKGRRVTLTTDPTQAASTATAACSPTSRRALATS